MTCVPLSAYQPDMLTIKEALREARQTLSSSESADLDAQLLLAHLVSVERVYLLAHGEDALSETQIRDYQALLHRRAAGEPIAYITGSKWIYDLELMVTPAVLIPRPETELLLEEALRLMAQAPDCQAADIGTGSGALAVAFARHQPGSRVFATDISADALCVARKNAGRYGASIEFMLGDLANPILERGIKLDLLMANLPYIPSDDLQSLAVIKYEPLLALDGGGDGLRYIRRLLAQVPQVCRAGAWVLLEIGADQADAVQGLVEELVAVPSDVLKDYAGLNRIIRFQLKQAG